MWTRHLHATSLVIVGLLLLLLLSYVVGLKPKFPSFPSQPATITITPTPTPVILTPFLYYDHNGTFDSFFEMVLETNAKQGMYGASGTLSPYSSFWLYRNQLYLQGKTTAGILAFGSHFFYPISFSSLPLLVSPDSTKALFQSKVLNQKTKKQVESYTLVNGENQAVNFPIPLGLTKNSIPQCWLNNENEIVFFTNPNILIYLHLDTKRITTVHLSSQMGKVIQIYCHSQTNTIYLQTATAIYQQSVATIKPTKLAIPTSATQQINQLIFSDDSNAEVALSTLDNAIKTINLTSGIEKQVYIASDGATLTPFLWKGQTIVYTQQSTKPTKTSKAYYIEGKILNMENQVDTVFASHQSSTLKTLGVITPISWIEFPQVQE